MTAAKCSKHMMADIQSTVTLVAILETIMCHRTYTSYSSIFLNTLISLCFQTKLHTWLHQIRGNFACFHCYVFLASTFFFFFISKLIMNRILIQSSLSLFINIMAFFLCLFMNSLRWTSLYYFSLLCQEWWSLPL